MYSESIEELYRGLGLFNASLIFQNVSCFQGRQETHPDPAHFAQLDLCA